MFNNLSLLPQHASPPSSFLAGSANPAAFGTWMLRTGLAKAAPVLAQASPIRSWFLIDATIENTDPATELMWVNGFRPVYETQTKLEVAERLRLRKPLSNAEPETVKN